MLAEEKVTEPSMAGASSRTPEAPEQQVSVWQTGCCSHRFQLRSTSIMTQAPKRVGRYIYMARNEMGFQTQGKDGPRGWLSTCAMVGTELLSPKTRPSPLTVG